MPAVARSAARRTRPPAGPSPLRRAWARLRRGAWVAGGWVPLTPLGLVALPLLYLAVRAFGGEHADVIVRVVCYGGLILLALDVAFVVLTALWLKVRRQPRDASPLELEAGLPCRTGYRLGSVRWNPLTRVSLTWEEPAVAEVELVPARGGWEEQVIPTERGETDRVVRVFTVSDLFGLSRLRVRRRVTRPVVVRPSQGRPVALDLVEQFKPGDQLGHPSGRPEGDLVEMRRYVAGDPLKLVLWKAYARTGRMLVRMPEKAVSPTDRTLAYLVAADGDEPAAGIARLALERGLLGREVIFAADGAPAPARTAAEGVGQIVRSVRYRRDGAADLDRFLGQGESGGTAACFLFVPHEPGPWLERVAQAMAAHGGPYRAVVGVDGSELAEEPRGLWRLLVRRPPAGLPRRADVRAVCDRLAEAGADVLVLDRRTGQQVAVEKPRG